MCKSTDSTCSLEAKTVRFPSIYQDDPNPVATKLHNSYRRIRFFYIPSALVIDGALLHTSQASGSVRTAQVTFGDGRVAIRCKSRVVLMILVKNEGGTVTTHFNSGNFII
jgi:hypothetical protein